MDDNCGKLPEHIEESCRPERASIDKIRISFAAALDIRDGIEVEQTLVDRVLTIQRIKHNFTIKE